MPSDESVATPSHTKTSSIIAGGEEMIVRRKNASYATGAYDFQGSRIGSTPGVGEARISAPRIAPEPLPPAPLDDVSLPTPVWLVLLSLGFFAVILGARLFNSYAKD